MHLTRELGTIYRKYYDFNIKKNHPNDFYFSQNLNTLKCKLGRGRRCSILYRIVEYFNF